MQELALQCGTSKATGHCYMPIYQEFLPIRFEPVKLLELGVYRGESMRLWLEWFRHPDTRIHGIDAEMFTGFSDPRMTCYACDHADARMSTLFPPNSLDVIVDDGGHTPWVQRASHQYLWPALKPGGQYWVEDVNLFHPNKELYPPTDEILRHWLTMPNANVWANFMDGFGNFRDDDVLIMVRK
jgi:hypothetical protein